jgi:single-strand DNA-binding protein
MSKSVNSVTLLGNLGQPVEVRSTQTGIVANISLATNERKKVRDNWEDHTEWHRVVVFGKLAEIARDYLKKGSKLYVTGRLRTTSWADDHQVKRHSTNIVADELILLDGPQGDGNRPPQPPADSCGDRF